MLYYIILSYLIVHYITRFHREALGERGALRGSAAWSRTVLLTEHVVYYSIVSYKCVLQYIV